MNELPPVVLRTADLRIAGLDDRSLRREAELGTVVRVVRGRYVSAGTWAALDERQRYCLRIRETMRTVQRGPIVSHLSAAAFWGFPVFGRWPQAVEVLDPASSRNSRTRTILRRPGEVPSSDVVQVEGVSVTGAARTAVDIALISGFDAAVMVFDHGLRAGVFDRDDLAHQLDRRPDARRRRAAIEALRLATPLAESPGESLSRAVLHRLGFPTPVLQQPFMDGRGFAGRVDFWWPDAGLIGEFDGAVKYLDPSVRNGRSADQVVLDEKKRADRLRALPQVRGLARWDYATAWHPERLASVLLAAGLRQHRAVARTSRRSQTEISASDGRHLRPA